MVRRAARDPRLALPVVFFILGLVLLGTWHTRNTHPISGDEPHYLVMADGLLPTFEIEQTGPYTREFRTRTISPGGLAPLNAAPTPENSDAVQGPNGLFNVHNLGLPMVLSVPYLLAGETGARLFLIAVGAIMVFLFTLCTRELHMRNAEIYLVVTPLAIGLPLLPATNQIYPDLPAGVLVLLGLFFLLRGKFGESRMQSLCLAVVLAYLPWLHLRYAVPMVLLLGFLHVSGRNQLRSPRRILQLWGPAVLSVLLLMGYNNHAFGHFAGPYEANDVQATTFTVMQFFGLLTDQNQGLLVQQPLHLLGLLLFGMSVVRWRVPAIGAALVGGSILVINSTHWSLYGGWSFNGRFGWTTFAPLTLLTLMAASRLLKDHPFVARLVFGVAALVQSRYLVGLFLQNKDFMPRFISSWPGTYSIFWAPIENALPVWTDVREAFTYFPNIVAALLVTFLVAIGVIFRDRTTLTLKIGAGAVALSGVVMTGFMWMWTPVLGARQWNGDFLPGNVGTVTAPSRSVDDSSEEGFLTFGPNWRTPPGRYSVTVSYVSIPPPGQTNATLDIFARDIWDLVKIEDLPPTGGEGGEFTTEFHVNEPAAGPMEFRTYYRGSGSLSVRWIRITPLPAP